MDEIRSEKEIPCLKCIYLIDAIRKNRETDGTSILQIQCGISGCPNGVMPGRYRRTTEELLEAKIKIKSCIEMLQRCIKQKSVGSDAFE